MRSGWEYNLILAVIGVSVATAGPGEWSLDRALGIADDLDGVAGLAIAAGIAHLALFYRPPSPEPEATERPHATGR